MAERREFNGLKPIVTLSTVPCDILLFSFAKNRLKRPSILPKIPNDISILGSKLWRLSAVEVYLCLFLLRLRKATEWQIVACRRVSFAKIVEPLGLSKNFTQHSKQTWSSSHLPTLFSHVDIQTKSSLLVGKKFSLPCLYGIILTRHNFTPFEATTCANSRVFFLFTLFHLSFSLGDLHLPTSLAGYSKTHFTTISISLVTSETSQHSTTPKDLLTCCDQETTKVNTKFRRKVARRRTIYCTRETITFSEQTTRSRSLKIQNFNNRVIKF